MSIRRGVLWGGALLILLIIAIDAYEAWSDRRAVVAQAGHSLLATSYALSEQTTRMIQEIDIVLDRVAEWRASAAGEAADASGLRLRIRSQVAPLAFVHSAAVFDATGHLRATTEDGAVPDIDLSHRPIFTAPQRAATDALYIGTPYVAPREKYLTFAVSRRLHHADGTFAGVVVVRVAFEYLMRYYSGVDSTPDGSIRLLRDDGIVLAQYPSPMDTAARDPAVPQAFAANPRERSILRRGRTVDGHEGLVALQKVVAYPLIVETARPLDGVLAGWQAQESASAVRTLSLSALAAALLGGLLHALRRRDAAELERQRLNNRLREMQSREALGFFAASVAHDFNNILGAIDGYGELARDSVKTPSAARLHLDRLLAASERARKLVRRVLTFDGQRSLSYAPINIGAVVAEALEQIRLTLPAGVTLRVTALATDAQVMGDAIELHQIVANLCTNASQAMPQGGEIELCVETVHMTDTRAMTVGSLTSGDWLCLSVTDSGVGLDSTDIETIFQPFYTTRKAGVGTGIGLTVVRNIVASMGGAVHVASRRGGPTRFSVYFPAIHAPVEQSEPGSPRGSGQVVLVVDNDPALVAIAEEMLASLGYEAVGFADPVRALAALRADAARFDALLSDERMSGLAGTTLAAAARAVRPGLPVVLMTAYRDAGLPSRASAAGIAVVLEKPLKPHELAVAMHRLVA